MIIKFIIAFVVFFIIFNILPKYKYIYVMKGTKLINEGNIEKGLELFEKGAYGNKTDYMTKLRYAFCELKFGDFKKAKRMVMRILGDRIPANIRYETKAVFAIILFKEGDLSEAKETMIDVYENFKNTNMYCTLGYLFNILETPQNAVKFNEEAYEYNSDHDVISDNLGQSYYFLGDREKANEIYETLIAREPKFPEAYYNYGLVLLESGDNKKAKEMFEMALTKPFHNLTTVTKEEIQNKLEQI